MKMIIKEILAKAEIVHYAADECLVTSHSNRVSLVHRGQKTTYRIPGNGWRALFAPFRMARRALRLDKCNVVPVFCEGGDVRSLIVIRQGRAHLVSTGSGDVRPTLALDQCRNVLHQSICRSGSGHFFFGKYGANPSRVSVPIYRSIDGGESWQEAYSISGGKARHVHGCFWDPYERRVWVSTGDFERENHLLCADEDFEDIEWLGDGSQVWRTCRLLFGPDAVYWMMDSHLEDSYSVRLDRRTRQVTKLQCLPGPVWYAKALWTASSSQPRRTRWVPACMTRMPMCSCRAIANTGRMSISFDMTGYPGDTSSRGSSALQTVSNPARPSIFLVRP